MSASSTWCPSRAPRTRNVSSACVALRRGRKPYDEGRKSASKIGVSTSVTAICTTRSRIVGIPSGRCRPSALGMYRRRTGCGRYVPARSASWISSSTRSTPYCSISASVTRSTPAEPRFDLTRRHASWRTSRLQIRSSRAWKRRSGARLAATQRRRCNWRTLSMGECPPGDWNRACRSCPCASLLDHSGPPQGSFPPAALFVAAIRGTTTPSDARCARLAFAVGLYEARCPDPGRADGPLVFRSSPCTRAAPSTPPRPAAQSSPAVAPQTWPSP